MSDDGSVVLTMSLPDAPRRFFIETPVGVSDPNRSRFGVYFPRQDECITDLGVRTVGNPEGQDWFGEWID